MFMSGGYGGRRVVDAALSEAARTTSLQHPQRNHSPAVVTLIRAAQYAVQTRSVI
jgi:hypothetical protein